MATWEDLDNELESDEEDAEDEAKIAMTLLANVDNENESSDVESCTDSETETQVYSKLIRSELVDSIKELLSLYENQSSALKKVKQQYIKLVKLHDSTKNEMEVLQYEYNNLKIVIEKGVSKPMSEHDAALQEFINTGIDRTKVTFMIYSINQNNKKGIGFIGGNSSGVILKPCSGKEELKTHFVSESEKVNTASCSEPEASSSKVLTKSKPENQKTKVMNNSKSKAPELQILKRSEPNKQVLKKTESENQKPRFQRRKAVNVKSQSKINGFEPEVWKKTRQNNFRRRTQRKLKTPWTNPRGPTKIWVPKTDIVDVAGVSKRKRKSEVLTMKEGGTMGFGGNQTGKIIGSGTIGNSAISINNVWLVDGLKHNLLSISQFFDNGYDVLFVKNNCIVINTHDQSIVFKGKRRNNVYKINFLELIDQKVLCLISMSVGNGCGTEGLDMLTGD